MQFRQLKSYDKVSYRKTEAPAYWSGKLGIGKHPFGIVWKRNRKKAIQDNLGLRVVMLINFDFKKIINFALMKRSVLLCHHCLKEIKVEPSFINSNYGSNHPVHATCKKKNDLVADCDNPTEYSLKTVLAIGNSIKTGNIIESPYRLFNYCNN